MKISHRNIPYSDIPRLIKEGVIKVGTKVRACEDHARYPNGLNVSMSYPLIGIVTNIKSTEIEVSIRESLYIIPFDLRFFLDILSDEEGVLTNSGIGKSADPKPLSFDEPLTKEAVGKRVKKHEGGFDEIINISIDGEWMYLVIGFCREKWVLRSFAVRKGWQFDSDKITIEEAEKLTGKKIKEETTVVKKGDGGMYTADFCSMCEGQLFKHWDFCPECGRKIKR